VNRSNLTWALKITSSSEKTPDVDTSLEMIDNKDLRNHSNKNSGGTLALINLFIFTTPGYDLRYEWPCPISV
jgi:hypothetical protein